MSAPVQINSEDEFKKLLGSSRVVVSDCMSRNHDVLAPPLLTTVL